MTVVYVLGDIFIGNFGISQKFGVNPQNYSQFNIQGHNGIDFPMAVGTQILAANDGWIREVGYDAKGFGNYIKVVHGNFITLYAHLQQVLVKQNDKVIAGQLIGLSGNTGDSSGPHLHFGVAPCDSTGAKTQEKNGFGGYINPLLVPCTWTLKNLKSPSTPTTPVIQPGDTAEEARVLSVLYQAYKVLRQDNGSPYGNLESMTRDLIDVLPKYRSLNH